MLLGILFPSHVQKNLRGNYNGQITKFKAQIKLSTAPPTSVPDLYLPLAYKSLFSYIEFNVQ